MMRSLLVIFLSLFMLSCTASRWVVTDKQAIDTGDEPTVLSETTILLVDNEPTVDNPSLIFSPYKITEKEYSQRVKTERTVQEYRPRWTFLTAGLAGAAFTAIVANTSIISPSASVSQRFLLNTTSGILAGLSVTNMKPVGDPIYTGEEELMRRSGTEVVKDSTRSSILEEEFRTDLTIYYEDKEIHSEIGVELTDGRLNLNLPTYIENIDEPLTGDAVLKVELRYNDTAETHEVSIDNFMAPHAKITSPVAFLRNTPEQLDINVITEIGEGSSLELIEEEDDDWYRVRFGGSDVFLRKESADIEWLSTTSSGPAEVVEFADVPFGDIDVEDSVPLLKQQNRYDRALVLTNGFTEHVAQRQYLDRDHRLFRFYMRYGLQMSEDQIKTIELDPDGNWINELEEMESMNEDGSLVVYLSGFAQLDENQQLKLTGIDDPEDETRVLTSVIYKEFERINPGSLYLFNDLEFEQDGRQNQGASLRSIGSLALQQTSNQLLRELPNSVIIYSNRPGQRSSLYTGAGAENMRHHIFNYYLAEALKQRKTRMSDVIRHLENNVDYTSRRLHDRPQEIQAFGNFTLDISQ